MIGPDGAATIGVVWTSLMVLAYLGVGRGNQNRGGRGGVWSARSWADLPGKIAAALPTFRVRTWSERLGTAILIGNAAALIWGDRYHYGQGNPGMGVSGWVLLGAMPSALVAYTLANLIRNEKEEQRRAAAGQDDGLAEFLRSSLSDQRIAHPDVVARKIAVTLAGYPNWQRDAQQWTAARRAVTFAVLTEEDDFAKTAVAVDALLEPFRR